MPINQAFVGDNFIPEGGDYPYHIMSRVCAEVGTIFELIEMALARKRRAHDWCCPQAWVPPKPHGSP
jgi:hypothetical protein